MKYRCNISINISPDMTDPKDGGSYMAGSTLNFWHQFDVEAESFGQLGPAIDRVVDTAKSAQDIIKDALT